MSIPKNYFDTKDSGRFDIVGKDKYYVTASVVIFILSVIYLSIRGLNYGIDFKGGTEIQILFKENVGTDQVRKVLDEIKIKDPQIQRFGNSNEYLVRFDTEQLASAKETNEHIQTTVKNFTDGLQKELASFGPEIRRVDTVGPQVGDQLKKNAFLAVLYSLLGLLIYVGFRFDYIYAPGGILCLFHDAVVTLAILTFMGKEMSVQILAAILTLLGYSINDTIIVYDRIRETVGLYEDKSFPWVINKAINDTLSRTIMTSFTAFVSVFCLYIYTDGVLKDFALTMCLGIVLGTYSSVYVASPCVIYLDILQRRKKARA